MPPVAYAQLAAQRGRLVASGHALLEEELGEIGDRGDSSADGEALAPSAATEALPVGAQCARVSARLGGSMYYV